MLDRSARSPGPTPTWACGRRSASLITELASGPRRCQSWQLSNCWKCRRTLQGAFQGHATRGEIAAHLDRHQRRQQFEDTARPKLTYKVEVCPLTSGQRPAGGQHFEGHRWKGALKADAVRELIDGD